MQKHMQKIEKLINGCDVRKEFIISSNDALDLCMDQSSFVYEACTGDHNIYAPICNNVVIENILETTHQKNSTEEHTMKLRYMFHSISANRKLNPTIVSIDL